MSTRVIGEIEPGSGAEAAGLRIGDYVRENMRAGIAVEEPERQYWLMMERDGENEENEIKWLPREDRTAKFWQLESPREQHT